MGTSLWSKFFHMSAVVFVLVACAFNPPPEEPCVAEQFETPGIHQCGLLYNDVLRWFQIYIPTGYQGEATPLVLDLHGVGSPITFGLSAQQYLVSHFDVVAEKNNFIAVWPQGVNTLWLRDHEFALAVIDEVESLLNIDSRRIYSTGVSAGGAFSHELGCKYSDRIAAIAPLAAPVTQFLKCEPENAIPVFTVHAPTDVVVPYKGTPVTLGAVETFDFWAEKNGCVGEPETVLQQGKTTCWEYNNCHDGVTVKFCRLNASGLFLGGHLPYQNNDGVKVSASIWEFFSRYSLP